jgi:hypothetical protein
MDSTNVMYFLAYIVCPRCQEELEGNGHTPGAATSDVRQRYYDHLREHRISMWAAGMMMVIAGISRTDEVPE